MGMWLARADVQKALHVRAHTSGQKYTETVKDLRPLYHHLVSKYRMLIYSGDIEYVARVLL
jgi:hypothetical protein